MYHGISGGQTLEDIITELEKPGRDPRTSFKEFNYAENIHSIDDLAAGMELPAIITNVTKFGSVCRYRHSPGRTYPHQPAC